MRRLLAAGCAVVALGLTSLAAEASMVPSPAAIGANSYGRYQARSQVLVVARPTFAVICPKRGGYGTVNGQSCDPFSIALLAPHQRIHAGGYIWVGGHRWWWVDLGLNAWGAHDYGWVYGPDVWAGRWAFAR